MPGPCQRADVDKVFCIECKDFSIPAGVCCSDKNLKDTWCMPNGERLNTPDIINKQFI